MTRYLLDTGPWIAYGDASDQHPAWAKPLFQRIAPPLCHRFQVDVGHPDIRSRPRSLDLPLEENRYRAAELAPLRNLSAALFRLESSRSPVELQRVVAALVEWLQAPEQAGLRRAFSIWLRQVLLPARLPGVRLDQVTELSEVRDMLAERVVEWTEEWKQQGLEEGRKEGRKEGREEGRKEGEVLLLQRQLERKFGPLDEATRARLARADAETLLRWGERVLEAADLAAVFAE